jgi:hydroxymethylpyrimidine/phosphomethylpyrimidine kinase
VTVLGGYAATAVTAITVQNTTGVFAVHPLPTALILAQARAVLDDIGADIIKTGMLGAADVVEAVADLVAEAKLPLVLDPVMLAKDGSPLLARSALEAVRTRLAPRARLITPNAPEAEVLTGVKVRTPDDLRRAAERLLALGCDAALVKGGHLDGERVVDVLMTPTSETRFESGRIHTRHTHGTGCTLASACAAFLAAGLELSEAVGRARDYVREAILQAPGLGAGAGPLHHAWPLGSQE